MQQTSAQVFADGEPQASLNVVSMFRQKVH
jgi:hypothetical protein